MSEGYAWGFTIGLRTKTPDLPFVIFVS